MLEVNDLKEKIEQLSRGEFIYELPSLLLSEDEIHITVESGSTHNESFTVYNSADVAMKGVLYSSSKFLIIDTPSFEGETNEINFNVNATELEAGEDIEAYIEIISDCGEAKIAVKVHIIEPCISSVAGKMKDLIQFADLANNEWAEAKQLFKSEELPRMLKYHYKKHVPVYDGLRKSSSMSQAMDEFLVSVHKKVEVKINIEKMNYDYEASVYSFMDKIILTKEGWGYVQIRISTDAPFLEVERKIVWGDNFIGDRYEVNFIVKAEEMKDGIHHGNIYIDTAHQTLVVKIKVVKKRENAKERLEERKYKQSLVSFTRNYLNFRLKRIHLDEYVKRATDLLAEIKAPDRYNLHYKLYQAHILMISGNESEASALLEDVERKISVEDEEYFVLMGLLTYLKVLNVKRSEDIGAATQSIQRIYQRETKSDFLLWCLLYLDKSYEFNLAKKYEDIKIHCMNGCISPILYYEAIYLMVEEPSFVKSLDSFERMVLTFGLRNEYFSLELARQVTYLAAKTKGNNPLLFYILRKIYERYQLKETLNAICTLLIRNHIIDGNMNPWYTKGVIEQLRITELPEYFMYSLRDDQYAPLPPFVLSYFNYNNKLPDKKKAYLYANIVKNKELDPMTYQNYEREISTFAIQKLVKKSMDKNYAVIYDDVFHRMEIDEVIATYLPDVAFYYQVECYNKKVKSVAVVHKELKEEVIVPFVDGKALIEIFSENCEIFLIGENNERYHSTIHYTLYRMLHVNDLMIRCYDWNKNNRKLLLYLAQKKDDFHKLDEISILLRSTLIKSDFISEELKLEYIKSLVFHYYNYLNTEDINEEMLSFDLQLLDKETRKRVVEMMILKELNEPVIGAFHTFGFQDIEVKSLVKFCSLWIHTDYVEMQHENIIVDICFYVFSKGSYDESILKYLLRFYSGTTKNMHDLWKAAKNFDIDTIDIEERLLGQILFAESYISDAVPVFMSYYRNGFNHKLIRAFLSYYAYKYLVKDRMLEQELFDVMKREVSYEKNEVCLLALLKYYSTKEELSDSEQNFIDYYIHTFEQNNIVLPFFKDLRLTKHFSLRLHDKYFAQYQTNPNHKVSIHYSIEGNEKNPYFTEEEMVHVCYGIFIKEFVLFENETLQYYITEDDGTESNITESKSVSVDCREDGRLDTNFDCINHIIHTKEHDSIEAFDSVIEQYIHREHAVKELFKPI